MPKPQTIQKQCKFCAGFQTFERKLGAYYCSECGRLLPSLTRRLLIFILLILIGFFVVSTVFWILVSAFE